MIVYQLACRRDHFFEGWFASSEACEQQAATGMLQCPTCSNAQIRKLPCAPYVHTSGEAAPAAPQPPPAQARAEVLGALRRYILANTENVGRQFAEIARRIHYKEEDPRGIRGQVTREEAEALQEEGVEAQVISSEVMPSDEVH